MVKNIKVRKPYGMKHAIIASIVLVLVALELILGVTLAERTVTFARAGVRSGYERDIVQIAEGFDEILISGKETVPDFTGSISNETEIVINGRTYTAAFNVGRNLKNNPVNIYTLSEICDNASADEYIISDERVYAVYSSPCGEDGVNLSFKNLEEITTLLSYAGFDGIVVFSDSKRAVFIKSALLEDEEISYLKSLFSYAFKSFEGKIDTQIINDGGSPYALSVSKAENGGYYIGGYADFTGAAKETAAIRRVIGAAFSIACIFAAILAVAGANFWGSFLSGKGAYGFVTDKNGNIVKANAQFLRDFPDRYAWKGKWDRLSEDGVYLTELPVKNGKKMFVCTVRRLFSGNVHVTARALRMLFGTVTEKETDAMKGVYELQKNSAQVLIGRIYFQNLQEIKNVFGESFAEEVKAVLIKRVKELFLYVFPLDDFHLGVIMPDGKTLNHFLRDASKMFSEIGRVVKVGEDSVLIKVKGGFALCDRTMPSRTYESVMEAAEAALRRTVEEKEENPETSDLFIYRDANKKAYARYMCKMDIPRMIENGDFYLEYQPQYSFKENRIVGFEALCRIKKQGKLEIKTSDVIGYAEHTGNMVKLGDFILSEGMRFAKSVEPYGVTVSLNVSPVQLMQAGFAENFLQIYRRYNLKPKTIVLEITESYLMQSVEETVQKLKILHENGVEIHLDDFGMQYSSFNYIKVLPLSAIKIDKSFISDIHKNRYSELITKTIVNLSEQLGYESICEGVETDEQLSAVLAQGCEIVQGYRIGKSVKEEKALEMILHYRYGESPECIGERIETKHVTGGEK